MLLDEVRAAQHVACAMIADEAGPMRSTPMAIVFSLRPRHARIAMLADTAPPVAATGGLFDAPASASTSVGIPADEAWARIGALCSDAAVTKAGHDVKAFVRELQARGHALTGLTDDTLISSYIVDATRSSHALDDLALDLAGYQAGREDDVRGKGVKTQGFRTIDREALRVYAGERADLALQIAPVLGESLDREGLRAVYDDLELPLVPVLADLERTGIRVDTRVLAAQASRIDAELTTRSARIYALAGMEFNINSPKQLAEVLFDKLQLPVMKRTGKAKTPSTGVEVLEELAQVHEMPREVLEWRAMMKLKGTYIDALPLLIHPATGRVHTTYNQAVAATGRLSSSDPNLQNIPIRTELGREIRAAFVAEPGCVLISADYSQIELRVLAHIARDQALIDAFTRGDDIHDQTALKVFGASSGLDPYELRRRAKIINYALLYGKTAFTLSKDIGVTQQAAQAFIDAYFAGYPGVRQFIEATLASARETGVVRTVTGRRRLVPEITSRNGQIRQAAERVAVNMPIQGTAADILKRAMIDLHRELDAYNRGRQWRARMLLTVHDELVFEARRECADEVAAMVKSHMEAAAELDVPVTVDVGSARAGERRSRGPPLRGPDDRRGRAPARPGRGSGGPRPRGLTRRAPARPDERAGL